MIYERKEIVVRIKQVTFKVKEQVLHDKQSEESRLRLDKAIDTEVELIKYAIMRECSKEHPLLDEDIWHPRAYLYQGSPLTIAIVDEINFDDRPDFCPGYSASSIYIPSRSDVFKLKIAQERVTRNYLQLLKQSAYSNWSSIRSAIVEFESAIKEHFSHRQLSQENEC